MSPERFHLRGFCAGVFRGPESPGQSSRASEPLVENYPDVDEVIVF